MNPAVLADLLAVSPEEIATRFDLNDSLMDHYANQPVSCRIVSEWEVEVATLLTHSETSSREISAKMSSKDGWPTTGRLIETRSKKFTY